MIFGDEVLNHKISLMFFTFDSQLFNHKISYFDKKIRIDLI